eukprot:498906_1
MAARAKTARKATTTQSRIATKTTTTSKTATKSTKTKSRTQSQIKIQNKAIKLETDDDYEENADIKPLQISNIQQEAAIMRFRKGLYVVQMLVIAGAILMAIGAYIAENNGWNFTPTDHGLKYGHMEEELIYLPYSAAGICLVTAVIGFVGAKTRKECGKIMLIVYIICVVMCCILSIASTVQAFADMGNRYHYAERQWDALTAVEEKTFEFHHYCCNFYTIEPCCRFGYGVTDCVNEYYCFEKVEEHLIEQFTIIGVTSGIQAFNLLCISLGSMVLYCYMSYKTYKKKNAQNWNNNDLLDWVKTIGLMSQW